MQSEHSDGAVCGSAADVGLMNMWHGQLKRSAFAFFPAMMLLLGASCSWDEAEEAGPLQEIEGNPILELTAPAFNLDSGTLVGPVWALWRNSVLVATLRVPEAVRKIGIEAKGTKCRGHCPVAEVYWQDRKLGSLRIVSNDWSWYTIDVELEMGPGELKIAFVNDRISGSEDLNLFIRRVRLLGEDH